MEDYVLITGATSGIGYEMAKLFHTKGNKLILVGRNAQKLDSIRKQWGEGPDIITLCVDLSSADSATFIYQTIKKRNLTVEILINNAGAGYVGEFVEASDEKIQELIRLNMTSLTLLSKYFIGDMMVRRRGKILNVASTGAYHPGPYTALYYASKAYVLSLTEALREEVKPYGITVSSLCPGATATRFAEAAGRENAKIALSPAFVAEKAYKGLMKGQRVIIPGVQNKCFVTLPKGIAKKLIGSYQRKLKKKKNCF